ncbi:hypothetical protein Tco_1497030, partial [Tanacetum coccineum]
YEDISMANSVIIIFISSDLTKSNQARFYHPMQPPNPPGNTKQQSPPVHDGADELPAPVVEINVAHIRLIRVFVQVALFFAINLLLLANGKKF